MENGKRTLAQAESSKRSNTDEWYVLSMRQMFTISEDASLQLTEAGHAALNDARMGD
jgi:hypothetical protein